MPLSNRERANIDLVFKQAVSENRKTLFEFEVYQIFKHIGLDTPHYIYVKNPEEITANILEGFNDRLMLKIVSSEISHKQKYGGVKQIKHLDPLFVQFAIQKMKEEVLSHFPEDQPPRIEGFLLVEYVPHTQALGYEVLIGIKESPAFGPVITMSKGGSDAEFFARHYDPANLFLPTLNYEEAWKMVNTLNIRYRFEEIGRSEYLERFAKAMAAVSRLARNYSFVSGTPTEYILTALDVNPIVLTESGRFVAIDGYAEFDLTAKRQRDLEPVNSKNLEGFFSPNGIAILGVSGDMGRYSLGRDVAHLLHDLERKDLFLINPKGGEITFDDQVYTLHQSLEELLEHVDLVVYAAPAKHIVGFMQGLHQNPPKAVILIPGIPPEFAYDEFVQQLEAVKPEKTRVIGPNCMGVFSAPDNGYKGVNTLFMEQERLEISSSEFSNTLLLTQSGAFSVTALDRFQHSKLFRAIVSFGNQYDVKVTDLIEFYARQKRIDVIALYLEGMGVGEGWQFIEQAQKTDKPIIVYKSGKTDAGAKAAASHTAAMSGSYEVFRAACAQSGVILVEEIADHYNLVQTFSLLNHKKPAGNKVAGVVNAGFESTVGADELKKLQQAELQAETIETLNRINRFGLVDTQSPFLDISPMADDGMYADFVEAIIQDENVDCVFVAIVPHPVSLKTSPQTCHDPDSLAHRLVSLSSKYDKPMVISVNAGQYYQEFVAILESNGLPVFHDIRSAIKSLDRFVSYYTHQS